MREIIFFSIGNSSDVSTWSNVPYLFAKQLEKRGIILRRVNLHIGKNVRILYNRTLFLLLNIIYPKHEYSFERTFLYRFIVNRLIKKSVKKYSSADFCIFFGYNFYNKFNNIPSLLFGDWTYEILIHERLNREFYWFEKLYSKREETIINSANIIISLFPKCADRIKEQCPEANVFYLGNNVINSLYEEELDDNRILSIKNSSKKILFIGQSKYIEGAKLLIESLKIISKDDNYELHIIGMDASLFENLPFNVFCHGYLRKDNIKERKLYYDLLISAKVLINPTPLWAGYSSIVEGMFFYTPIVVTPFKDFVDEFGINIDFGVYNEIFSAEVLSQNILSVIHSHNYLGFCKRAHERVKNYTWDNYIDKLLKQMILYDNKYNNY